MRFSLFVVQSALIGWASFGPAENSSAPNLSRLKLSAVRQTRGLSLQRLQNSFFACLSSRRVTGSWTASLLRRQSAAGLPTAAREEWPLTPPCRRRPCTRFTSRPRARSSRRRLTSWSDTWTPSTLRESLPPRWEIFNASSCSGWGSETHTFPHAHSSSGAVQVLRPLPVAPSGGGEESGDSPGWVENT